MTDERQGEVVRPALPLLLLPLGGLWLGLFCAEYLTWRGLPTQPVTAIAIVLAATVFPGGAFCLLRVKMPVVLRHLLALVMALILGLAVGLVFWNSMAARAQRVVEAVGEHPRQSHTLVILEDPKQGAISKTSLATLEVAGVGALNVRVFWDSGQQPLPLGTRLTARVTFKPLSTTQAFLHQRGVFGSVTLKDIDSEGFPATPLGSVYAFREGNRLALASIEGEGSALLRGVLLGDTTELDISEAGRAFRVTGLSHLVAVSGSHLVVIALLLAWLIKRLGLRRSVEVVLVTLLLASYVLLTGLQPSAIRACVMTFIASMGMFVGRRGHVPSALAAAAVGMLLLHPPTAFSVGFWLSVYAVFGLTVFCPLVTQYFKCLLPAGLMGDSSGRDRGGVGGEGHGRIARGVRKAGRWFGKTAFDPLALTVTAQVATLPITAPLFATVSLVSPLANLLVTPFITLLVGAGIAVLCLMPLLGPLGPLLTFGLSVIAEMAIAVAGWCAQLPHACLAVSLDLVVANLCALPAAALIYRLWPQPNRKRCLCGLVSLVLVAVLLSATSLLPVGPQVVMLDVGQGDAILVREGRSNILIDTGPSGSTLLRALARQRVSRLDAVIITHLDDDHCGALDALSGTIPVGHVFFASGLPEARPTDDSMRMAASVLAGNAPESLAYGDVLTLGDGIEMTMLLPRQPVTSGGNEESICLGLSYDSDGDGNAEARVLLTGDAESPQLTSLFTGVSPPAAQATADGAVGTRFDILKVGHHGSAGAVTSVLLERMGCRVALISAGRDNRYGHPTDETLSLLEQAGVAVYRTDLNGNITLRFEGRRVVVSCDTMMVESS
jgi:competence protein ComEC